MTEVNVYYVLIFFRFDGNINAMPTMVDFFQNLAWELIENKLYVKKNAFINLLDNAVLHLYM